MLTDKSIRADFIGDDWRMNSVKFFCDKFIHKLDDGATKYFKVLNSSRRQRLINQNFSIISNNCWGGYVYRYYGIPYMTPTIGGYFYSEDYLRFLENLEHFTKIPIKIIKTENSKWYKRLSEKGQNNVIVGKLEDIEYIFLHYKNGDEAFEKWERRKTRINQDHMLYKFSEMNECTEEMLIRFNDITHRSKLCFVRLPRPELESTVYFKGYEEDEEIIFDTYCWRRYIDIDKIINGL